MIASTNTNNTNTTGTGTDTSISDMTYLIKTVRCLSTSTVITSVISGSKDYHTFTWPHP